MERRMRQTFSLDRLTLKRFFYTLHAEIIPQTGDSMHYRTFLRRQRICVINLTEEEKTDVDTMIRHIEKIAVRRHSSFWAALIGALFLGGATAAFCWCFLSQSSLDSKEFMRLVYGAILLLSVTGFLCNFATNKLSDWIDNSNDAAIILSFASRLSICAEILNSATGEDASVRKAVHRLQPFANFPSQPSL